MELSNTSPVNLSSIVTLNVSSSLLPTTNMEAYASPLMVNLTTSLTHLSAQTQTWQANYELSNFTANEQTSPFASHIDPHKWSENGIVAGPFSIRENGNFSNLNLPHWYAILSDSDHSNQP